MASQTAWDNGKKNVGYYISWDSISCSIGGNPILLDVSGYCAPGTSVCILGASGSGKTTLIDILAQRKTVGSITGELLVNGMKPDAVYKRRSGYVPAETAHIPTMTVKEALMFAGRLKLPPAVDDAELELRVQEILNGLKLSHIADTRIGNELIRGVSSGEKKRLDIAIEMIGEPKLLFLDEPTSGLDEYGARFTMKLILDYVKSKNVTVIIIIHQPSYSVFQLFDNIMLLGAGKVCYFGKVSYAETYFTKMGQPTPQFVNPIEHYLDIITAAPVEVASFYDCSDLKAQNIAKVKDVAKVKGSVANFITESDKPLFEQSVYKQFILLSVRCFKRYIRNPSTSYGRFMAALALGLVFGIVFYNLGYDLDGYRLRIGLAAGLGFVPAFIAICN
ncbi:ABC transporter G member 22 [Blyttiomyces sp. JEL0837]|nr:ABC transporter G member 22 [Blyttiomyces sp. JEL0837]